MSTENENQVQQVELTIEEAKERIDLMHTLERLTDNKDFNRIINENYLKDEAVRLVMLRADMNFQKPEEQDSLMVAIDSIGQFRMFLSTIMQLGIQAKNAMASHEETLAELNSEALEED